MQSPKLPSWMSASVQVKSQSLGWIICILQITPLMASAMLSSNTKNRTLRPSLVKKYSRAMDRGEFVLNGESIIFDNFGKLMQGQHRLQACIDSNTAFMSLVVYGVDSSVFGTIDTGISRNANDAFKLAGVKNYTAVPAACTLLFRHKVLGGMDKRHIAPSIAELEKISAENTSLDKKASLYSPVRHIIATSAAVALSVLFGESASTEKSDEFFSQLMTGAIADLHSPLLVLRNKLIQLRDIQKNLSRGGSGGSGKLLPLGLTIKAWNLWIAGQSCKHLTWAVGDSFPIIAGSAKVTKARAMISHA